MGKEYVFLIIIILSISITSCYTKTIEPVYDNNMVEISQKETASMKITSPAFENGNAMPMVYSCDGEGVSPEIQIDAVPLNAKSLALIMDDPDAPSSDFVHWLVWNIPPYTKVITKGENIKYSLGKNGFGGLNYGAPCPPSGTHRYFFKLYALDIELDLKDGASKSDLLGLMEGHVLEETELVGTYKRS